MTRGYKSVSIPKLKAEYVLCCVPIVFGDFLGPSDFTYPFTAGTVFPSFLSASSLFRQQTCS